MIPLTEIKEKARFYGVPASTIERDYTQNWLLASFTLMNMALKGGTGIRKVHIQKYRFSDDLDFTLIETQKPEEILQKIHHAVEKVKERCGISFSDEIKIKETKSGFRGTVYFKIIPTGSPTSIGIHLDITDPSNEEIILPILQKEIFHEYSDGLKSEISSYSIDEIMSEKLRSLFQRTRARDLYDVYMISSLVDIDLVKETFLKKCENKNVYPDFNNFILKQDKFQSTWKSSLEHQIKSLPDFELVFTGVSDILKGIEFNNF